ncbi:hypothetical protein BOTBODRAFT_177644 [Botryobasidium botryosum FD-172 SS1]|uniref:Uncharacterized protein n=1 Tax=Botryobasidium botryosum (strain FD-172 SS1) TaxID=930990 RepID=A0A067MGE6_BOTB1|nr:hypothetical protein BOTBODRAFT_177644 [Botryobasidium botryosum FD-172 SS1]
MTSTPFFEQQAYGAMPMSQMLYNNPSIDAGRLLREAGHDTLVASGNRAYHEIYNLNTQLRTQVSTLQLAYDKLADSVSRSSSAPVSAHDQTTPIAPNINALSKADYPLVKYWEKVQWTTARDAITKKRGKASSSTDDGTPKKAPPYIEDRNGTPVSPLRMKQIGDVARSIWLELKAKGTAAETWGGTTRKTRMYWCDEMCAAIPELRYCEENWKALHYATLNYSSWYTNWVLGKADVKSEPSDSSPGDKPKRRSHKRSNPHLPGSAKKAKVAHGNEDGPADVAMVDSSHSNNNPVHTTEIAQQDIEQIPASTASSALNLAAETSPSGSIGNLPAHTTEGVTNDERTLTSPTPSVPERMAKTSPLDSAPGQAAAKQAATPTLRLTIVDPLLEAYGPSKEPAGPSRLEQAQNSSHLVPRTRAPARTGATIAVPIAEGLKGHTSPRNMFVTEQCNINPIITRDEVAQAWAALGKAGQKKYEQLSKAKKAALEKSA